MKSRLFLASVVLISTASLAAAALPIIPEGTIAKKKELLFSDDFEKSELTKPWHPVVPTFAVENGALKGTQTRDQTIPASDGKPEVKAHAAVFGLELPTQNSVVECRIKLDGATMVDVEYDDRQFTGSHYGHLCRAQVRLDGVNILDERDGSQSNALIELKKDPEKNKQEIDALVAAHSANFPLKVEAGKWYALAVEVVGEEMRVTLDDKPVAYLKSPGIGHATKSKIELGVAGKDGWFDDIKVWNAEMPKREETENRTWTSATGSILTGKLLAYRKGVAKIATDTNRTLTVRLDQLSQADRTFLETWVPAKGEHWRTVANLKKGAQGSTVASSQTREGALVSVTPVLDQPMRVDPQGALKTRYTFRTQIPPGAEDNCRCIVFASGKSAAKSIQAVQSFPLSLGYNEVSLVSLSTESLERPLAAGNSDVDVYVYVVDKRDSCISNIVLAEPVVESTAN